VYNQQEYMRHWDLGMFERNYDEFMNYLKEG
jgi:hypothetical protein